MLALQITVVAPWLPNSSRHRSGSTWLHTLGSWVPLPLLNTFVGFQNHLVYKQVSAMTPCERGDT